MPYKDLRVQKEYNKKQHILVKKKLTRLCPNCNLRNCAFGATCKSCARAKQGITWARKNALIRDDYTCQVCGLREVELVEVDHIVQCSQRPDLYADINNLMVLCPNCHKRKTIRDRKNDHYSNPV